MSPAPAIALARQPGRGYWLSVLDPNAGTRVAANDSDGRQGPARQHATYPAGHPAPVAHHATTRIRRQGSWYRFECFNA